MIDCGSRFAKTVCVRARRARSLSSSVAMRAADTKTSDIDDIQRMFDEY